MGRNGQYFYTRNTGRAGARGALGGRALGGQAAEYVRQDVQLHGVCGSTEHLPLVGPGNLEQRRRPVLEFAAVCRPASTT